MLPHCILCHHCQGGYDFVVQHECLYCYQLASSPQYYGSGRVLNRLIEPPSYDSYTCKLLDDECDPRDPSKKRVPARCNVHDDVYCLGKLSL